MDVFAQLKQQLADEQAQATQEEPAAEPEAPEVVEEKAEVTEPVAAEAPEAEEAVEEVVEAEEPAAEAETPAETEESAVEETAEEAAEATDEVASEPAEEAAPVEATAEEEPVAEAPEAEAVAEDDSGKEDDLRKIEGIGPKIAQILGDAGVRTFAELAETDADKIREILLEAGSRYKMFDPTTWPEQAPLAAAGDWDGLKKLQDELDGGRK